MTTTLKSQLPAMSASDANGALFGTTPIWDRKRKSGLFGTRKATAGPLITPHSTEPARHLDDPLTRPAMTQGIASNPSTLVADSPAPTTTARPRATTMRTTTGTPTLTIAAVVGTVGIMAAAGWLMFRDGNGAAEFAPEPNVPVTTAMPVPSVEPVTVAASIPAPTATTAPSRPTAIAVAPRVRPVARAAASGVVASTTLPSAPQPYSSLNPSTALEPVVPTPPVVEATPAIQEPVAAPPTITPESTTPPI